MATLLEQLLEKTKEYMSDEDLSRLQLAFEFSQKAHKGQMRKSGEPYISHPIAVADILAGIGMDATTIIAALLHDVVEDTDVSLEEIKERFGEEVARLVD